MTTDSRHAEGSTIDYLHGSLYIFSPAARLKVIDNFYSKAGNVAANCSYNTKEHVSLFILQLSRVLTIFTAAFRPRLPTFTGRFLQRDLGRSHRQVRRGGAQRSMA